MSRFKCSTEFCKRCGLDGGLCDGCGKKEAYKQGKEDAIEEINKAEDKLVSCFKKSNEIWTIRFAFAELREALGKEQRNE